MIDRLDRELAVVGVPARRRRRIRLELEDHLACDPGADLGDPIDLARQFADELGTSRARQAALTTFVALVPFGALFVLLFALNTFRLTDVAAGTGTTLVLGTQLAFVGGTLAFLRAWRLRRAKVMPAREAVILLRRDAFALCGGALTVISLASIASGPLISAPLLAWTTVAVGATAVVLGAAATFRAYRLRPVAEGTPGDLAFDLGPFVPAPLRDSPRKIAFLIAGLVALAIALDGALLSDGFDGLARGIADGAACLAGFALLGRYLGLRR